MGENRFVSVICEYNPFHFGHKYQMEQLKGNFDGVVCIMSGDIVQRGTAAVSGKYIRAEAALRSGANLVLELPLPWCCSAARDFARAGVCIAENIGSDFLAFGAEDSLDMLLELDSFVSTADFSQKVSSLVADCQNLSYPFAVTRLVSDRFGEEYAKAVSKPNNILALEYISAMKGKGIEPFVVRRDLSLASSSSIRAMCDGEKMLEALPEESKNVFLRELGHDFPRDTSKLDNFVIAVLRRMFYSSDMPADVYSSPQGLVNKIIAESQHCNTFDELVARCTDKIYTAARVRRAVVSTVFGITGARVGSMPPYTTVLAADSIGREILKTAKKHSKIDIITKPAKALSLREETKEAFLFAKSIEDVVALTSPIPDDITKGKTPLVI